MTCTEQQLNEMKKLKVGDRVRPIVEPGEYWEGVLGKESKEFEVIEVRGGASVVVKPLNSKEDWNAIIFPGELDVTKIRKRVDPCSWMDVWEE